MATALVALATTTLASSSATVTFSSIASGYRDYRIVVVGNSTTGSGSEAMGLRFNGDSGNNYSAVAMGGNGSSTWSQAFSPESFSTFSRFSTTGYTGQAVADILDATATDKHKTTLGRGQAMGETYPVNAYATRWANTAAITSIEVRMIVGQFAAGCVVSLYGVTA